MTRQRTQEVDTLAVKATAVVETNGLNGQKVVGTAGALWRQLADAGDAQAFINAYHAIDWSFCTLAEFARALHWALTAGAHLTARTLATTGAAQHPDDAELQKAARVLAPPKLLRRLPADPTIRANQDWLRTHRLEYRGQWVALRNGQLVGNSDSLETLTSIYPISPDILFTKVF